MPHNIHTKRMSSLQDCSNQQYETSKTIKQVVYNKTSNFLVKKWVSTVLIQNFWAEDDLTA